MGLAVLAGLEVGPEGAVEFLKAGGGGRTVTIERRSFGRESV